MSSTNLHLKVVPLLQFVFLNLLHLPQLLLQYSLLAYLYMTKMMTLRVSYISVLEDIASLAEAL
jgi:hypothetical protein